MASKQTTLNLVSASVGGAAAVLAFAKRVISYARNDALADDVFVDMRKEYHERRAIVCQNTASTDGQKHLEMQAIEKEFTRRRDEKLEQLGLNDVSKAWGTLKNEHRNKSILFAAISGVAVGGITYAVGRALRSAKSSKPSADHGYDAGYDHVYGGGSSDHSGHHDGGDFGHVFGDHGASCGDGGHSL